MMAAFQIGGSLLGRGSRGIGGAPARGSRSTTGGARPPVRRGPAPSTSRVGAIKQGAGRVAKGAGSLIAVGATLEGLQMAGEAYTKGKKGEAVGLALTAPLVGGWKQGTRYDKSVGKMVSSQMSSQQKMRLGKDTDLSNILALSAGGEERLTVRGGVLKQQKALYKLKEQEIKTLEEKKKREYFLSAIEQNLLDKRKKELSLMKKKVAGLKEVLDIEKKGGVKFKGDAQKEINRMLFERLQAGKSDIKSKTDVQERIDYILRSSAITRQGGRSAMESLAGKSMKGLALRSFMQQAEAQGVSKEQFGEMWTKQIEIINTQMKKSAIRQPSIVAPPSGAMDNLKQQEKVKVEVAIVGDNKGSSGEETVTTQPDGAVIKKTRLGIGVDATVRVSGETAKTKAFHSKKIRDRQEGNKQAR